MYNSKITTPPNRAALLFIQMYVKR
jgi:hypothetical protein